MGDYGHRTQWGDLDDKTVACADFDGDGANSLLKTCHPLTKVAQVTMTALLEEYQDIAVAYSLATNTPVPSTSETTAPRPPHTRPYNHNLTLLIQTSVAILTSTLTRHAYLGSPTSPSFSIAVIGGPNPMNVHSHSALHLSKHLSWLKLTCHPGACGLLFLHTP